MIKANQAKIQLTTTKLNDREMKSEDNSVLNEIRDHLLASFDDTDLLSKAEGTPELMALEYEYFDLVDGVDSWMEQPLLDICWEEPELLHSQSRLLDIIWGEEPGYKKKFSMYIETGMLQCQKILSNSQKCSIFWADGHDQIVYATSPKVQQDFMEGKSLPDSCLIMFWKAVEHCDGRRMFTTKNQPFVVIEPQSSDTFTNKLSSYGMRCFLGDHEFIQEDNELGMISRVFQDQRMEFTRNIFDYYSQESTQRYPVMLCGIKSCVAIPFRSLGVIEILSQLDLDPQFLSNVSIQSADSKEGGAGSSSTVQCEKHARIKANYKDEFIKFRLSTSSGIDGLNQQVSKRLKLEDGTYVARYQDKQNDWILIACDEDVRECVSDSSDGTLMVLLEPVAK